MDAKHTPGPWRAIGSYRPPSQFEEYGTWIFGESDADDSDPTVAWIQRRDGADANINVIAAAPDLLAALRGAMHLIEADYHAQTDPQSIHAAAWRIDRARAAIAKAEGR